MQQKSRLWFSRAVGSIVGGVVTLFAMSLAGSAQAQGTTVLTFDFGQNAGISNGSLIPQAYGDNVNAATMGDFNYGGIAPFTPNVTTLYSGGPTGPSFQDTNYGDLVNVAIGESNQLLLVTLSPGAGTSVTLNSFDLGGFPDADYTINAVQVFTENGLVFEQLNALVLGATGSPRHSAFTFSNLTANSFLTIQIDALNLGAGSNNIGIDNISFTQNSLSAAPEPATFALLGVGLGIAGLMRRR